MSVSIAQSATPIQEHRLYTEAEYLEMERRSLDKHCFINGKIILMAGASPSHLIISANIFGELFMLFYNNSNLHILPSDTKIYIPDLHIYHYPDALVVSGKPEFSSEESGAILNPVMIVEVLSDSTGRYDRLKKFTNYQAIPGFKEYVLIHQDRPQIDIFLRQDDPNLWRTSEFSGLDQDAYFQSIGASLSLSKIYRNISFDVL